MLTDRALPAARGTLPQDGQILATSSRRRCALQSTLVGRRQQVHVTIQM